jgi:RNA polymerase subunit RPABC4/transcription elongation factor Spt4
VKYLANNIPVENIMEYNRRYPNHPSDRIPTKKECFTMKECPNCHAQIVDITKFCPECGSQFETGKSGLAIVPSSVTSLSRNEGSGYSKELTEMNPDDAALAFVYTAQFARFDGPEFAGVLVGDCEQHFVGMAHLLEKGAIEERGRNELRRYITTPRGNDRAAEIIKRRLAQTGNDLKKMLNSLSPRFVLFFRQEVLGSNWEEGRRLKPGDIGYRDEPPPNLGGHFCLLNEPKIKKLRDNLMATLIHYGLAETSLTYDSKKPGGLVYSLAPDVAFFLDEYLAAGDRSHITIWIIWTVKR